ncbi:class I lanthipeptide [Flavobacterium sp.]|uniref:class I lanthipeptide n=1 Tax=Flavobacterium sp. TaxID=239 RepID=UPI003750B83C
MKKQNTMNKLAFNKAAVTELSMGQLLTIQGGTGNGINADYDDNTNIISGGCGSGVMHTQTYI